MSRSLSLRVDHDHRFRPRMHSTVSLRQMHKSPRAKIAHFFVAPMRLLAYQLDMRGIGEDAD